MLVLVQRGPVDVEQGAFGRGGRCLPASDLPALLVARHSDAWLGAVQEKPFGVLFPRGSGAGVERRDA